MDDRIGIKWTTTIHEDIKLMCQIVFQTHFKIDAYSVGKIYILSKGVIKIGKLLPICFISFHRLSQATATSFHPSLTFFLLHFNQILGEKFFPELLQIILLFQIIVPYSISTFFSFLSHMLLRHGWSIFLCAWEWCLLWGDVGVGRVSGACVAQVEDCVTNVNGLLASISSSVSKSHSWILMLTLSVMWRLGNDQKVSGVYG